MPLFFDSVQQASWAGYTFPISEITVLGTARLFVHEYPHADGGNLEPLGRKPYVIRMQMIFDEGDIYYPGNYPTTLDTLRFLSESGTSAKLVVPNVGTIQAFCPRWTQTWTSARRSGETAEYEWIEDQRATLKQVFFTGIASSQAMSNQAAALAAMKPQLDGLGTDPSILQKVLNAVNDVLVVRDRADLTATLAADKIASLTNALQSLNAAITTPVGVDTLEALKQLWYSTIQFQQDVSNIIAPPSNWTVPALMSIGGVSMGIYGDTSHQTDLLAWNEIDDAFAIPAGTSIRYLPQAA